MAKQGSDPTPPPASVDARTGLPVREAPIGVSVSASPEREAQALRFAIEAARSLHDDKCDDVLVLDLRGRSQVTDFFVIASGTSERQLRSAAQHVAEIAEPGPLDLYHSNLGESRQNWYVLDFVDVVTHVLMPDTRRFYDMEMLWGDAPRVEWEREGQASASPQTRNKAGLRPGDLPSGESA